MNKIILTLLLLTLLLLDNNPGYPTTLNYLNENVAYFKTSGFRRLHNIQGRLSETTFEQPIEIITRLTRQFQY